MTIFRHFLKKSTDDLCLMEAAQILRDQPDSAILLDVRSDEEWNEGHLPGALHIPHDQIPQRAKEELPQDKPLFVYCRSGHRAGLAKKDLEKLGFTEVHNVGGILDYKGELLREL
ncbi:rhodanese-like domain-containing protein [Kallipyga gabonensis]|uniref:rhodanese-like domain-containing protein n=1 Tax=Kallipyga gabonensis TaxID=1686287 RepID=UPI0006B638AB|nr:rhodanese-like domain-containing protein [Kallipyga gabonensis]